MLRQIHVGGFDDNFSYFIEDPNSKRIAIVDPSNVKLLEFEIQQDFLLPKMIFLTHSHFDHTEGITELVEKFGIPVYMHENARGRVDVPDGMSIYIKDGEKIKLGDLHIEVMHTPGHIDDAVCFYLKKDKSLITGDTVFVEGCGRVDLEFSNVDHLFDSLQKIKKLPDDTKVFPGHDYGKKISSTIEYEKKHNPYFKVETLDDFIKLRLS